MQPTVVERLEFEYERHGTQCLSQFGGSNRTSDCSMGQTRTEADFWLIFRLLLLTQQVFDLHYRSIEYSSIGILGAVGHSCGLNQDLG